MAEFNARATSKDGRQAQCRACAKSWYRENGEVHRARVKVRKVRLRRSLQERILNYLAHHPCEDCGEADLRVLEFDHRDPRQKVTEVANLVRDLRPWTAVLREIEKCDVRCANCHRIRTAEAQSTWRAAL